jgi:hypothetical protein
VDSSRGRWALARIAALLLAVALLSPVSPFLLVSVPLAVLLLAFRSRRLSSALLAAGLAWLAFTPTGEAMTPLWYGERAWTLITAGAFVGATLLWPRARLAIRAIAAVAFGFLAFGLFGLIRPEALSRLDWWMASELRWTSHVVASWLTGAEADSFLGVISTRLGEIVELQITLYPSLLALATLAALGVAWSVSVRLAGSEAAVGPLREFGFSDHFIWVAIGGLLLLLLPIGQLAARIGENALAFMGGLYVLRGVAVLAWIVPAAAVSSWSALFLAMAALLFYPILIAFTLVLGVSDTWLHLRTRFRGSEGSHGSN